MYLRVEGSVGHTLSTRLDGELERGGAVMFVTEPGSKPFTVLLCSDKHTTLVRSIREGICAFIVKIVKKVFPNAGLKHVAKLTPEMRGNVRQASRTDSTLKP